MNIKTTTLLDAALGVFLRSGFKRTTMGDIAIAAGLSRPTLYARYANKDDVYAACFELYVERQLEQLSKAWAACDDLTAKMDCLWDHSILPAHEMLVQNLGAADIIEGTETPAGQLAVAKAQQKVVMALSAVLAPYKVALHAHGQSPEDLARFIDNAKHTMLRTAKSKNELIQQFSTLKAATLALTT